MVFELAGAESLLFEESDYEIKAGKETEVAELQNYYTHEYMIELD